MEENKNHGGSFGNGFLLGVLVGGVLVFLLATEKGRRILRMLTEEGFNGASELRELLEEPEEEYEEEMYEEPESNVSPEETKEEVSPTTAVKHPVASVKRFFRGTHKKSVS